MFKAYLGRSGRTILTKLEMITDCNFYAEDWRWINNSVSMGG